MSNVLLFRAYGKWMTRERLFCEERVINSVLNQERLGARVDEIRTQFEMIDFTENMPDIPYASSFGTISKIC